MNESELLAALVALAKQHPYVAAALGLWLVLSLGWKAQPKEKREAWGKAYPRPVSALRFLLEILPDLLGAGRVLVYGMIRGQASREPQLTTSADSPIRGELRETSGPVVPGVQLNNDGTPPARYVAPERETQAPPPPSAEGEGR